MRRYPKIRVQREEMVTWLRSMANDLEKGGAYIDGHIQFQTTRSGQATATFTIVGEPKRDATVNA